MFVRKHDRSVKLSANFNEFFNTVSHERTWDKVDASLGIICAIIRILDTDLSGFFAVRGGLRAMPCALLVVCLQ